MSDGPNEELQGAIPKRQALRTDLSHDYFSVKSLCRLIGCGPMLWKVGLTKELLDNAADACERAAVEPVIHVELSDNHFAVRDNGDGMSRQVVRGVLDFSSRISCNARYVGPSRGQAGNALKCIICAPPALFPDDAEACVVIESDGVRHHIRVAANEVGRQPRVFHDEQQLETDDQAAVSRVKNGTYARVGWPQAASCTDLFAWHDSYAQSCFTRAAEITSAFAMFNPDMEIWLNGGRLLPASRLTKWRACNPSSAHWYNDEQLASLIGAFVRNEREGSNNGNPLTIWQFVRQFAGLSSTSKATQVCGAAELTGRRLADLVADDDELDHGAVSRLLTEMKSRSRPIQTKALGCIGKDNFCRSIGAFYGVDVAHVRYRKKKGEINDIPYIVEAVFAPLAGKLKRIFWAGINWTPTLIDPTGALSCWLDGTIVKEEDPAFVALHIIMPLPPFTDQAKSRVELPPPIYREAEMAVTAVTREWTAARRKDRHDQGRIDEQALEKIRRGKVAEMTAKEAAWQVMPAAHAHVTGGNPAEPVMTRQVMYSARRLIQALTTKTWKRSATFTQKYLPDYIEAHLEETKNWVIAYDARGTFIEPHGGRRVDIGTLPVRAYIGSWKVASPSTAPAPAPAPCSLQQIYDESVNCDNSSVGPNNRYHNVLIIEKQGFADLIAHHRVAERYDLALGWTKGMSTTACRELVEALSKLGLRIFVLHDFDVSGLTILHTLRTDTRRFRFSVPPNVIDIGLRLSDAQAMGLEGEHVKYTTKISPRLRLARMGATADEQRFLVNDGGQKKAWFGRRVELNEMTNLQFITFLEQQLDKHGVKKIVPDADYLSAVCEETIRRAHIEARVTQERQRIEQEEAGRAVTIPPDLESRIRQTLQERPELPWNRAVEVVASEIIAMQKGD